MKKQAIFLLSIAIALLCGCSGSGTYRGVWKAVNSSGEKFQIVFEAKSVSIKDSTGNTNNYEYTQNSVSIKNSVETYGINLSDGRSYLINFPIADDESKGVIEDQNGNLLYLIGRKKYIKYEEIYGLR